MTIETRALWRTFLVSWLVLTLLSAVWTFATPIGGAPDEPAHLVRAASVVTGQLAPFKNKDPRVRVPEYIWYSQAPCFAGVKDATANCLRPDTANPERARLIDATSGRYNPLYYAAVGWPSLLFTSNAGIYAMRLMSDLLVMAFLAMSFALLSQWRRPTLALVGFAAAVTPMVIFLGGVVNPNSLEITAVLATFVAVLTVVHEPAPALLSQRAVIITVAASVAANTRPLSLVWVAVAIVAPLILLRRGQITELLRARALKRAIAACAATFATALGWWLFANPLNVGSPGTLAPVGIGTSHIAGFGGTLLSSFYYGQQLVGFFGWLDSEAPPAVYFVWAVLIGGLIVVASVVLRGRRLVFGAVLIGAFLLLPALIQGYYVTTGGFIWQGRYILPVFACAMVGVGAVLGDVLPIRPALRGRLFTVVVVAWSAAQLIAFATVLKRYTIGTSPSWSDFLHPKWQAPGGNVVELACFGVLSVGIAVVAIAWHYRTVRHEPFDEPSATEPVLAH